MLLIVETYNDFVRFHGTPHTPLPCDLAPRALADQTASLPIRSPYNTPRNPPRISVPPAIRTIHPHFLYALSCHSILLYGVSSFDHDVRPLKILTYCRWRAYTDASRNGLVRFQIPFIGPLAERWVYEE